MTGVFILPENRSTVKSFYFEQEALGKIPSIRLTVNDVEITPVNKLSINQSMANINYVRYPGKKKINFEALEEYNLGDVVELRLYHEGAGWDKLSYYHWPNAPASNVFKLKITGKEYTPAGIDSSEMYSYECDADFRGMDEKVNVGKDDSIFDIVKKMNFVTEYEGKPYAIAQPGEYKINELFSHLAEYATFKTGTFNTLEIEGKKAKLISSDLVVVDHVTKLTTMGVIKLTENSKDVIQLAYWKGVEIEKRDKIEGNGVLLGVQGGKHVYYTGVHAPVKHPKYFDLNMGQYLEVFNAFVPDSEIPGFLTWKIQQVDRKQSFRMGTLFVSTPLGGRANVEVKENTAPAGEPNNGIGWTGAIVGKSVQYKIGKDIDFDYSIEVVKTGLWVPKNFDWGDDWDSGAIWGK